MSVDNTKDLWYSFKCGICSFAATYVSGVLHPLDLIKTRFQSHDGKGMDTNLVPRYKGIWDGLKSIHKNEGFRGLYKGFYVSLLSQALATGFFFWLYEARKKAYEMKGLTTMNAVTLASIQASLMATFITQPIWVVKTRMLLNIKPGQKQISHAIQKIKQIHQQNGIKGFLKGLTLSLALSFSGVLQMYIYEGSKIIYYGLNIPTTQLSQQNFICGSISKLFSILITYPITTVRTRIQQNQFVGNNKIAKYTSVQDIFEKLVKEEGIRGFYKGLWANMAKGIPQRGIYFYFYEQFKNLVITQTPQFLQQ